MSYKVILVHLDAARNIDLRIQFAIQIAKVEQAQLIGIAAVGLSRYFFESALSAESLYPVYQELDAARDNAKAVAKKFEEECWRAKITFCESHVVEDDAYGSLERRARYCDLLMLGQYDAQNTMNPMDASLARDMLLSSGGPILLVPQGEGLTKAERRVLIAWNGSIEARRAVQHALPLLRHAETINVVVFSPTGEGEDLGTRLLTFLHRHGITAGLVNEVGTYHDAQKLLLTTVADTKSNLLVMGGYGHTPFQETLLGGVTRAVLHAMPVPVLMSH